MRKYIPIIILLVLSAFNVRMAEGLARKALVAPDCMINNLINVAKVASGVTNMDYLLDENLNNYATFSGVAGYMSCIAKGIVRSGFYAASSILLSLYSFYSTTSLWINSQLSFTRRVMI